MKATDAFDICHEIYAAAREIVDTRLPTMQMDSASKFLWRPDRRPRLVEFVADFALAGQRALTPPCRSSAVHGRSSADRCSAACGNDASQRALEGPLSGAFRSGVVRHSSGTSATSPNCAAVGNCPAACGELRASRLILFRMYYLGGAEYQVARRLLGIGELTWSAWTEEIRTRVGRELVRSGIFPPGRYFRQPVEKQG